MNTDFYLTFIDTKQNAMSG